jgi:hypothetical protein
MATFSNNFDKKISSKYFCEKCDYETSKKSNYNTHCESKKHKYICLSTNINKNKPFLSSKIYNCDNCDKNFKERTGLWRHKKKCIKKIDDINSNYEKDKDDKDNLISLLLSQNKELMDLVKSGMINNTTNSNNNNTTNNDNKIFNLQFFLNETCKDAMNINEFVSSIKVNLDELENTGRQGYIEGISSIILKRLNKLEQHFRPLHCSDLKREVFYVKENNEWKKENENKAILTKAIKVISNENMKQIKCWRDKYPDCTDADSNKNNLYLKIVSNSMNGLTIDESNKNIEKIISNVAKEVIIDKTSV